MSFGVFSRIRDGVYYFIWNRLSRGRGILDLKETRVAIGRLAVMRCIALSSHRASRLSLGKIYDIAPEHTVGLANTEVVLNCLFPSCFRPTFFLG